MSPRALLAIVLLSGCAATPGGATCEDAHERFHDLSCVEGYTSAEDFVPVCELIDPTCVVEANDCTHARACLR